MADNITFQTTVATPPSATVVATDDVGGVHFQRVKIDVGAENSSALLGNSNPLPISDAGGSLTVDGTVDATLSGTTLAGQTAVTADYDTGGTTQNLAMLGVAIPGAGGAVAGGTFTNPLRVDPTGTTTQPVSDGGGSLTVDGSITVGAALPAGNNNIGDVDVASIAAGDNTIGRFKLTDGTTVADVFDYTNSNPLAVRLTDTNGDYIAAGGGTQYAEDTASATGQQLNMAGVTRADTAATQVDTDGDRSTLIVDSTGRLHVNVGNTVTVAAHAVTNAGTFAVQDSQKLADNAGFTDGTTPVQPTGYIYDEVAGTALTENDIAAARINLNRAQINVIEDGATRGRWATVSAANALKVDGSAVTQPVSGTVTANLAAGTNNIGDVDVLSVPAPLSTTGGGTEATALRVTLANDSTGVVSIDDNGASITVDGTVAVSGTVTVDSELPTAAALADNTANPTVPAVGAFGMLWDGATWDRAAGTAADGQLVNLGANNDVTVTGTVTANLAAGTNNIGDVDVLSVPAPLSTTGNGTAAAALRVTVASDSTGVIAAAGQVAHDAVVSGNPIQTAGEARSSDPTAVASGDVSRIMLTLLGKQLTLPYAIPASTWSYAAASGGIVNTTGVTAKTAGGAGIRNYITSIQVINGHASVDTDVQIRDGASGTVLWRGFAKSGGGGISCKCDPPLRGTANTLVEIACGTTGSAVYVNLQGYVAGE